MQPHFPATSRWLRVGALLLSTLVLFLGFYRNQWEVVREKKFKQFQLDSESLVIARMVESRQHGIASENGLLGWGDADPLDLNESDYQHQYDVYLSGGTFQSFALYKSVSGLQGMLFSTLDRLSPFSPAINLRNFRALEALLFALTLSIFAVWTLDEFGVVTATFVLVTMVLSQWLALFGHNLFYFIWASFLPLGAMSLYLAREDRVGRHSDLNMAAVGFGTILFKCLVNGYDFIIPALAMPAIPVVYFGFRRGWDRTRFARRLFMLAVALLVAVGISIVILAMQLQISEGSFTGGLASIFSTLGRRTYADPSLYPAYADSLMANPWSVLWTYFTEDTAIGALGLTFLDVTVGFAVVTALYVIVGKTRSRSLPERSKAYALIGATWVSFLVPVSWFLIFKGQAYVHTHTNYLAWHMPFTLFGYAMCAFLVQSLLSALLPSSKPFSESNSPGGG